MSKKPICGISNVFVVFLGAITLSFGGTYEGKSSYYLITRRESTSSETFEVYNALDEVACISLCNNKDGCFKGVYNRDSKSCFLEMATCKTQRARNRAEALISTGEKILQFSKLGHTFDFEERKFRGKPHGTCHSPTPFSCKEIYETDRSAESGAYFVYPDGANGTKVEVYCHMTVIPGCGDGGWTLVMKIDGAKDTFRYDSRYWSRKETFNPPLAHKGLDHNEGSSPAYWDTPLTKLCLGMRQRSERETHWIMLPLAHAQTLHSLIADGGHRPASLRREKWLSLMTNSSLGLACSEEGFNPRMDKQKVRIGMIAGKSCHSPWRASLIGFGSTGNYSCGNFKGDDVSGMKHVPSFGYILVQ